MKRTEAVMLLHLVFAACSSSGPGSVPKQPDNSNAAITLYDVHRSVIARLTSDGTITDGASHVVTHYDVSTRSMSLLGKVLDVAESVHVAGSRELEVHVGVLGPWHVRVLPSNEVEVDGNLFALADGIEISQVGMFRLGVLLCAVPMLSPKVLRVYRGQERLTIQMDADDQVLDGVGAAVGRFDLNSRVVTIGDLRISLDEIVRARDGSGVTLELPIGTWRFDVASDGALRLNDEHWGRLEGFDSTPKAWLRLEALFASLPVMPVAPRPREPAP
jgi:hypothetical protein